MYEEQNIKDRLINGFIGVAVVGGIFLLFELGKWLLSIL